jgi:short-subunit dehydrogenase
MQGVTTDSPTIAEYTITKHAVVALTEILRDQLAAREANVHVSVLLPGGVSTGLSARERERIGDSALTPPTPMPADLTQPSEVAAIAVDALLAKRFWIFSHEGSYERVKARVDDLLSAFD